MADSPDNNASAVVKLSISCGGEDLAADIQVVSVHIHRALFKIPKATLVLLDGDMPNQDFPLSSTEDFVPGQEVIIKAGYGADEEVIFTGIIIKHGISVAASNYARLVLECRDAAVAMTVGRKNANYVEQTDSDIISSLLGNYSLTPTVDSTDTTHGELVQYNSTDWDFMLARAEANGLLVAVDDGEVSVAAPTGSEEVVLSVTYGTDLMQFDASMDARSQYSEVKAVAWSPADLAVIEEPVAQTSFNAQGNLDGSTLAEVLGLEDYRLQSDTPMQQTGLKQWATAQQIKSDLSRIRGQMRFQGSSLVKLASLIEVNGLGDRFNGDVFISAFEHRIEDGEWLTDVEFGLSPDWFMACTDDVMPPPAAGLLPGAEGLHIGIVKQLDQDPDGEYRIQVSVPLLQAAEEGIWARLIQYYASAGFGLFMIPEIGDEVVLGYFNHDPSYPVILGSLYSSKNTAPFDLTADNFIKALVTKSELKLQFDDEKKDILLETPGGHSLTLSDENQAISIEDSNGNKIETSDSGISISSPKDISIQADGKITISATDALDASSSADVSVSGMNVTTSADVGMTAKGGSTAEFSASGQTTVKGAMVMIN